MKTLPLINWRMLASLLFAGASIAAPVEFVSGDSLNEGNSLVGVNTVVVPNRAWQQPMNGAQWISGWGNAWPDNSAVTPVARFWESFTLGVGSISGALWLHADDSATVFVNGSLVFTGSFVLDSACSLGAGGCEPHEIAVLDIGAFLRVGENRIEFDLYQLGSNVAGIMYGGRADAQPDLASIPEPQTLYLIALPLLVIGICARWTRRPS